MTRKAIAWSAAAAFGALLVLVRVSHPAKGASAPGLATPGPLLAQIESSGLGGGSIAPASAPPAVATSSS